MEKAKIDRINALAAKSKTQGLTEQEKAEQAAKEHLEERIRIQIDKNEPFGISERLKKAVYIYA